MVSAVRMCQGCARQRLSSWTIDVKVLSCMQVKYAFLAGLAVVLLLVPINRWLALKIQRASEDMMAYKDVRWKSALLCLGMCSVWSSCVLNTMSYGTKLQPEHLTAAMQCIWGPCSRTLCKTAST